MTDTSPARTGRSLMPAFLVAGAVLAVPLAWPLLTGRVFTHDDFASYHLPVRVLYQRALRAGDSTMWTPSLFSGFYLLGEGQAGSLHPWHWAIYRWLPITIAFNLELLSNYAVAFAGAFVLGRRAALSRDASILGAMLTAFCGFNLLHAMHLNAVAVFAHLPALLAAVDALFTATTRRALAVAAAVTAAIVASQWLLGFPQAIGMTAIAAVPFAIVRAATTREWRRLLLCAAAAASGTLVGAVQWMPTIAAAAVSVRATVTPAFALSFSLHPFNLIWQFTSPYAVADRVFATGTDPPSLHEFGLYPGAFAPVAVTWIVLRWRGVERRRLLAGCAALAVVALVLALGRYTPVARLAVSLPGFPAFRAPTRHLVLAQFALAAIAACAFDDMRSSTGQRAARTRSAWFVFVPAALGIAATLAVHTIRGVEPAPVAIAIAGPMLIAAAGMLALLTARGVPGAAAALVVFAAVDLAAWAYPALWQPAPETVARLASKANMPTRAGIGAYIHPDVGADGNIAVLRGVRLSNGYVALYPARRLDQDSPPALRLAGVWWTATGARWTRVDDPLPRARLVASTVVAENANDAVSRIHLDTTAVVEGPIAPLTAGPGSAEVVDDRPGRLAVQVSTATQQLLVLTERYDEGWTAGDGCTGPLRVNGDFLGCVVRPGVHRVQFEFTAPSFVAGRRLAGAGLALLLIVLGWIWRVTPDGERVLRRSHPLTPRITADRDRAD